MNDIKLEWWRCSMEIKDGIKRTSVKFHKVLEGTSIGADTEEEAIECFERLYGDKYDLLSITKENKNVKE